MSLLKELDQEKGEYARVDLAIAALRDELVALNFAQTRGQNRLLSLCVAKLDEAQGLALIAAKESGRLALVDRKELLRGLTDTTDKTVENGAVNV